MTVVYVFVLDPDVEPGDAIHAETVPAALAIPYRWAVTLDGQIERRCRTRDEAKAHAKWLRRHPVVLNRAENSGGQVRIIRTPWGKDS